MAYGRLTYSDRTLVYGLLVAGAIVFSFPFLWMVGTSIKVRREMAAARLRVMPMAPRPRDRSPYIDSSEFEHPGVPDGLPESVWQRARPELEALVRRRVAAWRPVLPGSATAVTIPDDRREDYETEMTDGVFDALSARVSDEVRGAAAQHQGGPGGDDAGRGAGFGEPALAHAVHALTADVDRLVTPGLLEETFDRCYRRVALGAVRIRTVDYKLHALYSGAEWQVAEGPASLVTRTERGVAHQAVSLAFEGGNDRAVFAFRGNLPVAPVDIDRIFVVYRGDESWARVTFEVVRDGRLYRTREAQNLSDRTWVESELRWPSAAKDRMGRRTHLVLRDHGAAEPGAPDFEFRLALERNTWAGAWRDKILLNYRTVFREVPFARYIMTSLSLSLLCIVLSIFSCTLAAYAFARLQWPGRDLFFGIMLATMMIPAQVTMIPGFLIVRHLGWYNTLLPLWVFHAFGSAFFIFLLRQFFKSIPADLEDAARIDGCGFLRIYWHVLLPLVKPTLATVAIYTFMGTWNNFMGPLIYVNDERLFPLALGLFKFSLRSGGDIGLVMAGSFLMTLPILVMFFFLQRYFIQGISLTGTKG